jgi:hypothetical protein
LFFSIALEGENLRDWDFYCSKINKILTISTIFAINLKIFHQKIVKISMGTEQFSKIFFPAVPIGTTTSINQEKIFKIGKFRTNNAIKAKNAPLKIRFF